MNFIFFHVNNVFSIIKPKKAKFTPGGPLPKQIQINSTKFA